MPGPREGFRDDALWPFTAGGREKMLARVVEPLAHLLPSVVEVRRGSADELPAPSPRFGYRKQCYAAPRFLLPNLASGIRPLRAEPVVGRYVTITLRECEHWPTRNSNIGAWEEAAKTIRDDIDVVVIRDETHAGEPLGEFAADETASTDLNRRAALYAGAALNLGVNNGPMWMAVAMDAPVLILKPTDATAPACSAEDYAAGGVTPGNETPFGPRQRIVWADDTATAIIDGMSILRNERKPDGL